MKTIVFHIGLAKTGTTSFQHFCQARRRWLLERGVLYPRSQIGRGRNHSPLVASYIPHRCEGPSVAMRWAPRAEAVRALRAEIDASTASTVLISSEHFSTHFDRSEAAELAADFAGYDQRILVVLRDTHARFLSSYNTHVTAGGCLDVEAYARSMLVPGTRFMSAAATLRIWREAFDTIDVVDYDAAPDITRALLERCGVAASSAYRDRASLGPAAIEVLRAANEAIRRRQTVAPETSVAAWMQLSAFSILARRRVQAEALPRAPVWQVSAETLAALDAAAAADRNFLAETLGLSLAAGDGRARFVGAATRAVDPTAGARGRRIAERVMRGRWALSRLLVAAARPFER